MNLGDELIQIMESAVKVGEYDQRSALGIADSYVRGSNIDTEKAKHDTETGVPTNRDGLALSLIEALGDAPKDDCKAALQSARRKLNEPYANDPKILAWRARRGGQLGTLTGEKAEGR